MPHAKSRASIYCEKLNDAMAEFHINTIKRQAAFIAQLAHESGEFRYVKELASGTAYEGRKDLGNTHTGDGVKYKGRGLIQITGRSNYEQCGLALGVNLISTPQVLETPEYATRSAAWFWKTRGLNELADRGEFNKITRRINGGTNGAEDRLKYYERALKVII